MHTHKPLRTYRHAHTRNVHSRAQARARIDAHARARAEATITKLSVTLDNGTMCGHEEGLRKILERRRHEGRRQRRNPFPWILIPP